MVPNFYLYCSSYPLSKCCLFSDWVRQNYDKDGANGLNPHLSSSSQLPEWRINPKSYGGVSVSTLSSGNCSPLLKICSFLGRKKMMKQMSQHSRFRHYCPYLCNLICGRKNAELLTVVSARIPEIIDQFYCCSWFNLHFNVLKRLQFAPTGLAGWLHKCIVTSFSFAAWLESDELFPRHCLLLTWSFL